MAITCNIEAGSVKIFRRIILILALLLITGLVFLLGTTAGLKTALTLADRLPGKPVMIAAKRVEGRLLGHFILHDATLETPTLSVKLNRTELLWSPSGLLKGEVSIDQLIVADGQIALASSETDDTPTQSTIGWLPDVSLEAVNISSVQVKTASDSYSIESISGKAALQSGQLTLSDTQLLMPGLVASVSGAVNLQQSSIDDLQLQWDWQPPELLLPVRGSGRLKGDAENMNLTVALDSPTASLINAEIQQALTTPTWQAEFSMAQINLQHSVSAEMPDVNLLLKGHSNGNIEVASIDVAGSVIFDGVERPWKIDAKVPLTDNSYPELAISSGQAQLTITPDKEHKEMAALKLNIPYLAELWPGLSGQIKGDAELTGSRLRPAVNLSIAGSDLVAGEQSLRRIEVEADFNSALPADVPFQIAAVLEMAHIAGYKIDGNLQLQGTPQDASLDFKLTEAGQGAIQMLLNGTLTKEVLTAKIEQLILNHPETGQWQAKQGAKLMVKQGAGELSLACLQRKDASICSDVAWQNQRIDTSLDIKSLQLETIPFLAQLSDYQLNGRLDGQLNASVDKTIVEKFSTDIELTNGSLTHRLQSGDQQRMKFRTITLKGEEVEDKLKLDLKLNDAYEGMLQATVSLPANLQLLQKPDAKVTGRLNADLPQLERFNVFLQQAILPAGKVLADIRLDGSLTAPRLSGEAALQVPVIELGEPATVFRKSRVELKLDGTDISLQGQSELAGRPFRLHGSGRYSGIDDWHAGFTAQADGIPLASIPAISLQDDFALEGNLKTKIDVAIDSQLKVEKLDAELAVGNGILTRTFIDGEKERLVISDLRLAAHNEKDQLLVSGLLKDDKNGRLDMKLMLPAQLDRLSETDLALDGKLSADFPNLQAFGIFLDDVSLPEGRFLAAISVSGSTASPQLKGNASLDVPRLDLTEPVISFDNTHLDIQLSGNELSLIGSSMIDSRPVVLDGTAMLQSVDMWNTKLKLTAESIRLDDVFGSSLQTSPDLVLLIEPGMLKLSGDIVVEGSEIVIRDLSSTIRPSSDVRIVGKEKTATPPWRVITDIGLNLTGENRLRIAGFNGLLDGNIRVRSETGKLTSGEGALTVTEGTYRAFGATVPIRRGRLEFIGGTLDDPAIQIESRRRVEQREVGFDVSGTLQTPIVTLVSNPSMDQSEILSWLLFGRGAGDGSGASTALLASSIQTTLGREEKESFLQRMLGQMGMSGVNVDSDLASGGVGLSTQLTPRLLIKYRVDVWEQTNRLILRYHLNQHWALEGISGNEGGADILYEREH